MVAKEQEFDPIELLVDLEHGVDTGMEFKESEIDFLIAIRKKCWEQHELQSSEIIALFHLWRSKGFKTKEEKKEEREKEHRERNLAEEANADFQEEVGLDPKAMIEEMLSSWKLRSGWFLPLSAYDVEILKLMLEKMNSGTLLSTSELHALMRRWEEYTVPWPTLIWRVAKDLPWGIIVVICTAVLFVVVCTYAVSTPFRVRELADVTAELNCVRYTYFMKSLEDKGDSWEGYDYLDRFVKAPKETCSVRWKERPKR